MRHPGLHLLVAAVLAVAALPSFRARAQATPEPSEDPPPLVVLPLGNPSPALVELTVRALQARFDVPVIVAEDMPLPKAAWYAPRKRWRAEKLLNWVHQMDFGRPVRTVVAVTDRPISTTKGEKKDWGIAGLAFTGERVCILSDFYLRKVRPLARYERFVGSLVHHETGHALGLDHCPTGACVMADAKGNIRKASEATDGRFCDACAHRLVRWLDPADNADGPFTFELAATARGR